MNCPRCGEPMRIVATDSGGAYFCPSCRGARERAILSDRIRDADAKESRMLMRVIKLLGGGSVEVEYVDVNLRREFLRTLRNKRRHVCILTYLHDPARFGVNTTSAT